MLRNKINATNNSNNINNSKGGVKMLRNNKIINTAIITGIILTTITGSTLALETKPDPENYEKTTQYIKEAIEETQENVNDAKDTLAHKDQWSEMTIGAAEATMEGTTKSLAGMKRDLVNNQKRIEFNKKYNLPSYSMRVYNDKNKHNVDKKQLYKRLLEEKKHVSNKSNINNGNLDDIVSSYAIYNPKNITILTEDGIPSICLYGSKFEDYFKSASQKDVIIRLVEVYGTNNDCMEKILSYNDKVKYPELKDVPSYERRFINFAFDNKLYPRTKQINLKSGITEKQVYDIFAKMIIK